MIKQCAVYAQLKWLEPFKLIGYILEGSDYSMKYRAEALYKESGAVGHMIVKDHNDFVILRSFGLYSPWMNYSSPVR